MTHEDRLDILQEFAKYYKPRGSWQDLMIAWKSLTREVWKRSGQSYPSWFQKYIDSWKVNCFNADKSEALITLTDAIKEYEKNEDWNSINNHKFKPYTKDDKAES